MHFTHPVRWPFFPPVLSCLLALSRCAPVLPPPPLYYLAPFRISCFSFSPQVCSHHPLLGAAHGEEVRGQGPEGGRGPHPEGLAAPGAEPLAGGEGAPGLRDRAVGGR